MTYSGSVVPEKICKSPYFCILDNYLPFEEEQAFYLKNLEFPLPKDDMYKVWLKLTGWF
jgi:hypothetical protein